MAKPRKRASASTKTPAPPTVVLYVRIPHATAEKVRDRVVSLGWPHTVSSVVAQTLEHGFVYEAEQTQAQAPVTLKKGA